MVDRPYYPTDARRYSRGGPLLPVSFPERHRYSVPLSDARASSKIMGDRDSGADAPTRKRISVAVSRRVLPVPSILSPLFFVQDPVHTIACLGYI